MGTPRTLFLPCYRYTEDHAALVTSYYIPKERVRTVSHAIVACRDGTKHEL